MIPRLNSSLTEAETAVVEDLHDWLSSNARIQAHAAVGFFDDAPPAWYAQLLSTLTLLVASDRVDGVFSEAGDGPGPVNAVVVTEHRIIHVTADTRTESAEVVARTYSRARILEVEATEAGRLFAGQRVAWPAIPAIRLRLNGEDQPLTLPHPTGSTRAPDMVALLRSFIAGLEAR